MNTWAMLALNFDEVEFIDYPRIGQPKLNGIRAKWDGEKLTSRQGKVWAPRALPAVYQSLTNWSTQYPGIILDGELYCHGAPFQEIEKRCAVKRVRPHEDHEIIRYHAFDIISNDHTEARQITLSQIYPHWVPVCHIKNKEEAFMWLRRMLDAGYEGLMLRSMGAPYLTNRTEALIKLKPEQVQRVTILKCIEGLGKFKNMLGAFKVRMGGVTFNVGGGSITEKERLALWNVRDKLPGREIIICYRDLFTSGKPVQPQIYKVPMHLYETLNNKLQNPRN